MNNDQALRLHLRAKPLVPTKFKLLYEHATSQALFQGLYRDFPSAGLISSEGAAILNGAAFNDLPKQNALYSGDSVTIDRVTAPSFVLTNVRLSVFMMVQPSAIEAHQQARGNETRGSGLWARFLVNIAGSTQGTRFVSNGTVSTVHCGIFNDRTRALLNQTVQTLAAPEFTREILKFSPEACHRYHELSNWVESQIALGGRYFDAGDHASKLMENVGRVAAVLHHFEGFEGPISHGTLNAASEICDAASWDFARLFVPPPQEQQDAMLLADYFNHLRGAGWQGIAKNRVRQYGPNVLRNKDRLDCAITTLCSQGLICLYQVKKTIVINLYPPQYR